MKSNDIDALDYFVAGVPAGVVFQMSFDEINVAVESLKETGMGNTVAEVCLIGLVAYFEAFCKNQFAAIINIFPPVLKQFCCRRKDVAVSIEDLLLLDFHPKQVGFIISEKFDFGSAKIINSLYHDLISITPFSKSEIKKYDLLLNNRNLLVHHAGIYTMKYKKQILGKEPLQRRVFYDSLVVEKKDFAKWAQFIETMVIKIIDSSHSALTAFINQVSCNLSEENKRALDFLNTYNKGTVTTKKI